MISAHIDMGADITMAVKKTHLDVEQSKRAVVLKSDSDGNLTDAEKAIVLESVNNALANPLQMTQSQYTTAP